MKDKIKYFTCGPENNYCIILIANIEFIDFKEQYCDIYFTSGIKKRIEFLPGELGKFKDFFIDIFEKN